MLIIEPLLPGEDPPAHRLEKRHIDVHGRKEHEEYLKDPEKCREAGLDIAYERMVYLKRWGGWLDDEPS
jgi:hypothetical protein